MKMTNFFERLKLSFALERIICRLLAAWLSFTAFQLLLDYSFARLEYAQNTPIWYMLVCIALLFLGFSCANILLQKYESDTWLLMISAATCALVWLHSYQNNFFTISVTAVLCLSAIYFVHKNEELLGKWQPGKGTVWAAAIAVGLFSCFIIGGISSYRHLTFSAPNFDFGIFVNMFHNMRETGMPLCTSERDVLLSHFAVHISPIYYLLLPFYMIFPSALTLQIGQAVILASGVIPVVLLCKHFKISGKATILLAAVYCLYPALSTGCFYDIHENCFLTPLLLWLFYFFERKKWWCMYVFAILTLSVKEDAAIYVILFALYVLLAKKKYVHGGILLVGSLLYFAVALTVLKNSGVYYGELYADSTPNPPINGPMINRYNNVIYNSADGLLGAIKTALLNPGYLLTQLFSATGNGWEKVWYFLQMFLPLGLIPFFTSKPSRWLLITPILLNLITNYTYQYDLGFQYHFGISAFLIYAVILNVPDFKSSFRRNVLCVAVVACFCMYVTSVIPTFWVNYNNWQANQEKYIQMDEILDTIPKDASVCCSTYLLSHLADRDEIYELNYHGNVGDVDYVIFDARYKVDEKQLKAYQDQGYVVLEEHKDMLLILQKG